MYWKKLWAFLKEILGYGVEYGFDEEETDEEWL